MIKDVIKDKQPNSNKGSDERKSNFKEICTINDLMEHFIEEYDLKNKSIILKIKKILELINIDYKNLLETGSFNKRTENKLEERCKKLVQLLCLILYKK